MEFLFGIHRRNTDESMSLIKKPLPIRMATVLKKWIDLVDSTPADGVKQVCHPNRLEDVIRRRRIGPLASRQLLL